MSDQPEWVTQVSTEDARLGPLATEMVESMTEFCDELRAVHSGQKSIYEVSPAVRIAFEASWNRHEATYRYLAEDGRD